MSKSPAKESKGKILTIVRGIRQVQWIKIASTISNVLSELVGSVGSMSIRVLVYIILGFMLVSMRWTCFSILI